jgi:CubicO group peptidase (beta-lactamase class C family)
VTAPNLAELLREHTSHHSVPGASIGLLRDGVMTVACAGVAAASSGEPVTPETRFSAGSLTKSMVATVIARLAVAGGLSLDDPVAAHVPEVHGTEWGSRATVLDLLANRTGGPLREALEFDLSDADGQGDDALARFAARIARAEPTTAVWSYTNAGWCVLGRVVETVTGLTWEDAMRAHLLHPLGMAQTTFATGSVDVPRATGHRVTPGGAVPVPPLRARAFGPAGTTMISTVEDLLRFAALHLEDPSLTVLRESGTDIRIHGWFDAWCLGQARFDWEGGPAWGWDGLVSGERGFLRMLPDRRGAVVMLTNGSTGRAMYRSLFPEIVEEAFGIRMPPLGLEPSVGAAVDLGRFAGTYAWPDRHADVTATEAGLRIAVDGRDYEARPIDDRAFLVDPTDPDNPTVTFGAFDERRRPHALYVMLWGLPRVESGAP